jgi:hypothetical protein
MRLWHLPYSYLDGQRLLSQHLEVHGLATCIATGRRWGRITDQFRDHAAYLALVHLRCVVELGYRAIEAGRTHDLGNYIGAHPTPLDLSTIPLERLQPYRPSRDEHVKDVEQLRAKWEREGYYFGTGPRDLRQAEVKYGLPPGRPQEQCDQLREQTRARVKANRARLREMGDLRLADKLELLARAQC